MTLVLPRVAAVLLLTGALLIGLAQIVVMPPWEGFDEPAHYSYISRLAETGQVTRLGEPMSREIDAYLAVSPAAKAIKSPLSYSAFFSAPPETIARGQAATAAKRSAPLWAPGAIPNWQGQHPPLYYALLAPVYLAASEWSLMDRLLLMRSFSYLLAWLGLCVAAIAVPRWGLWPARDTSVILIAIAAWPTVFPMWFPEMARIGNDSLVILLVTLAFLFARRLVMTPRGIASHVLLGGIFGVGLLTKATFLPLAAATCLLLAIQAIARRHNDGYRLGFARLGALGLTIVLVAGCWYALKLVETGTIIGSNDAAHMRRAGGLLAGLLKHGDVQTFARFPWVASASFFWNGTWSFVLPPRITIAIMIATTGLIALACYWYVRARDNVPADLLSPLVLAIFLAALLYESLVLISIGEPGAPFWYLHSYAPAFAPLVAFGMAGLAAWPRWRVAVAAFMLYPVAFLPLGMGVELVTYAGCGATGTSSYYLDFSAAAACAQSLSRIATNLSVFGAPGLFVALFILGWGLSLVGVVVALRFLFANAPAPQASMASTR